MHPPTIQVTIVDSAGVQQTFQVGHLDLDCGSGGCIDVRPGKPAFCRGFERGVLTLDDGTSITTLTVTHGRASLTGDAVHVICEQAVAQSVAGPHSPDASPLPIQPTETEENEQQTPNYTI